MGDQQRLPVWGRGGVQGSCPIGTRRGRDRARRRLITLSRGNNARHKYLLRGAGFEPQSRDFWKLFGTSSGFARGAWFTVHDHDYERVAASRGDEVGVGGMRKRRPGLKV